MPQHDWRRYEEALVEYFATRVGREPKCRAGCWHVDFHWDDSLSLTTLAQFLSLHDLVASSRTDSRG